MLVFSHCISPQGSVQNEDADDDSVQRLLDADTQSFLTQLIEQQQAGKIQIPAIIGEAMPPEEGQDKTRPLTSDYLIPPDHGHETVYSALTDWIAGNARDIKLMPVQTKKYSGKRGKGKIWLLKGSQVSHFS